MTWFRWQGEDLVLRVRAHPGARSQAADGIHDGAVRVSLRAPAVDDQANQALLAMFAADFGVPRRQVVLEHGRGARHKRVRVRAPARIPDWFTALGGRARPT